MFISLSLLLQVVQTLEDHHQEVLSLYRDYGFHGLIAQDSEFALCNIPAYFSSHALKLSWNGKNLTTHQYLLSEAARQLGLKTQHLPMFAALLGRHCYVQLVVQEVKKSFSNQKVASSIHCRSVLEQDTEPLIAPDVQCAISVNVKCVYIVSRTYVSRFG